MNGIDLLCTFILGGLIIAQLWRVWDANREYQEAKKELEELERRTICKNRTTSC